MAATSTERRYVTALFCDVVDSVPLGESLDAEDLHGVLREYQEVCAAAVGRYDAEICRHVGDGVLVCFGYPRAHEDDAYRAVRAALEIVETVRTRAFGTHVGLGVSIAVRIGIHSGPVVIGDVGGGGTGAQVLGHAMNLAARLQSTAEPNAIVMSRDTLALVEGFVVARDLGAVRLKGVREPVPRYELAGITGARGRLDAVPDRGLTPFVGRANDCERLAACWELAGGGSGQAVFIHGEAGVGKSRLVRTFREQLAGRPHTWLECCCSPFTANSALYPLIELVAGLAPADRDARGTLDDAEGEIHATDAGAGDARSAFERLLSQGKAGGDEGESPERVRRRTLEALVEWTLGPARECPTVLVLEDFHWSDPSTREFVGLLLQRLPGARLLCIVTHRPDFSPPWGERDGVTLHGLRRLSASEAATMAGRVVSDGRSLSPAVCRLIAERADGIPLYVEELVKAAVASRASDEVPMASLVPTSLHGSLMARLDALGDAKHVAQLAATIGREVPYDLLAAVTDVAAAALDAAVERLVRAGILCPLRGADARLSFKHALIRDIAYESLPRRARREVHARIAGALPRICPDWLRHAPELLGYHLLEANEIMAAAEAFDRAGRVAASRAAYEEATSHYRNGLAALERAPRSPERDRREVSLQIMLGNAIMATRGYGAAEIISVWERARDLGHGLADLEEWSSASNGAAVFHMQTGDCAGAVSVAVDMLRVAEDAGIRVAALRAHGTLAQARFYLGDMRRALAHAEQSRRCYEPGDFERVTYGSGYDQFVIACGAAALAHWALGHYDRALAVAKEGLEHARAIASSQTLAMALSFVAFAHHLRREWDAVLHRAGEVAALAGDLRFPVWQGFSVLLTGAVHAIRDREPRGLDLMDLGFGILGSTNDQAGASFGLAVRAEAQLALGRREDALLSVDAGLAVAEATGQPYYRPELLRLKGEILVATAPDEAMALLHAAVAAATGQEALALEVRAATALAAQLGAAGRQDEAARLLAPRVGRIREGAGVEDVERARTLLASLGTGTRCAEP